eukprot:Skav202436  [mRNA]  locus=scaffold2070:71622:72634:+ [translate_table: standard]
MLPVSKEWAAAFLPVLRLAMDSFEANRELECIEELGPNDEELDPNDEELDPNDDAEYWNELRLYQQGFKWCLYNDMFLHQLRTVSKAYCRQSSVHISDAEPMGLTDEEVRRHDDELANEEWGLEASFREAACEAYDDPFPWEGVEDEDPYDGADHWDEFRHRQNDDEVLNAEGGGNALAA